MSDTRPKLHVACCSDNRFLPHTAAMLTSVIAHHAHCRVHCHLVSGEIPTESVQQMRQHIEAMGATFHDYTLSEADTHRFHLLSYPNHLSIAAYHRIFLPTLLDEQIERVLYLDGDIVVRGDLLPFFQTDLGDNLMGVIADGGPSVKDFASWLPYPAELGYFNSGVLLLDLKRCREFQLLERCIECFKTCPTLRYDDQDVLNVVLAGKVKFMPLRYNAMGHYYRVSYARRLRPLTEEEMEMLRHAVVVHFTGPTDKPWRWRSLHPFRHDYFAHLARTPWAKTSPRRNPIFLFRNSLRWLLVTLHLTRRQYIRL